MGMADAPRKKVVIVGGGFGGVYAALELDKWLFRHPDVDVTVVNRDNFFLFTPMLHEVAASDLDITNIVSPVRKLVSDMEFFDGDVEKVDLHARTVTVSHGDGHTHDLPYDHLVLAPGSVTNFFDLPGLEERAITMKSLGDAIALRNRMIEQLEEAETECGAPDRDHLMTFVVAGGRVRRRRDDRRHERLRPPGAPVLPAHPARKGADGARAPGRGDPAGALREARPLRPAEARGAGCRDPEQDKGRVRHPERGVCLSDGTESRRRDGHLDGRHAAQSARQDAPVQDRKGARVRRREPPGGRLAGRVGARRLRARAGPGDGRIPSADGAARDSAGKGRGAQHPRRAARRTAPSRSRFKTIGQLASLGRRTGVAQIFGINFSGFVAWWMWRTIYLMKLPRLEKRLRVAIDWTWDLIFSKDLVKFLSRRKETISQAQAEVRRSRDARCGIGFSQTRTPSEGAAMPTLTDRARGCAG